MNDLISRLKEKPEHHRRHYTFGAAAFFTAFIFIIWASVILPGDMRSASVQQQALKPKGETPVSTLRSGVASVYEATKSLFKSGDVSNVDFEAEYERVKNQVESGELDITPTPVGQ